MCAETVLECVQITLLIPVSGIIILDGDPDSYKDLLNFLRADDVLNNH